MSDSEQPVDVFALLSGSTPLPSPPLLDTDRTRNKQKGAEERQRRASAGPCASMRVPSAALPSSAPLSRHASTSQCSNDIDSEDVATLAVPSAASSVAEGAQPTRLRSAARADSGADKENQLTSPPVTTSLTTQPLSFSAVSAVKPEHSTSASRIAVPPLAASQPRSEAFAYSTVEWKPNSSRTSASWPAIEDTTNMTHAALAPRSKQASTSTAALPNSAPPPLPSCSPGCSLRFVSARSSVISSLAIPDVFSSVAEYQQTYLAAMSEQINNRLAAVAQRFIAATQRQRAASKQTRPQHTAQQPLTTATHHINAALTTNLGTSPTQQQRDRDAQLAYRHAHISYYQQAALQLTRAADNTARKRQPTYKQRMDSMNKEKKRKQNKRRAAQKHSAGRAQQLEEEEEAEEEEEEHDSTAAGEAVSGGRDDSIHLWLGLADLASKEKAYGKDDLWVLSNDSLFGWRDATQPQPHYSKPWVIFVVSEYRSFADKRGLMKVRLLAVEGTTVNALPFNKQTHVYGVRALSLARERRNYHITHCAAAWRHWRFDRS